MAADLTAEAREPVSLERWNDSGVLRSGYLVAPASATSAPVARGGSARIVYLNRDGGTYRPVTTVEDSSANRSIVISLSDSPGGTLTPFPYGDNTWNAVVSCVRRELAPYDIDITETDPGSTPHIESVVAGSYSQIGIEPCLGVAPFNCGVIERAVNFTFAAEHPNNPQTICWTVLQETAHALGLDHELLCADPMTYLESCGHNKVFQDVAAQCGEDVARACSCGGSTQNSVAMLRDILGESVDRLAPLVAITSPPDGASVPPGFRVMVDASDDGGVVRAELYIDGELMAGDDSAPWEFETPTALADGAHTIEVRVTDAKANASAATVDVTIQAGATDPAPGTGGGPGNGEPGSDSDELIGGCAIGGPSTSPGAGGLAALGVALAAAFVLRRRRAA